MRRGLKQTNKQQGLGECGWYCTTRVQCAFICAVHTNLTHALQECQVTLSLPTLNTADCCQCSRLSLLSGQAGSTSVDRSTQKYILDSAHNKPRQLSLSPHDNHSAVFADTATPRHTWIETLSGLAVGAADCCHRRNATLYHRRLLPP